MFSNNGESDTFHSSFINEKDSLITDFSYENYYPFMIKYPDIDSSVNDEFIFDNQKNPNSIFFENLENPNYMRGSLVPNEITNKTKKFNVLLKSRGPKPKHSYLNMKRHRHLNTHFDNLQIKIQVHFISFIINLANDVLFSIFKENKKYNFKDIDHLFKIDVSRKNFDFLKSSKIKDILAKKISKKYIKYDKNINEQLLNEVYQKSTWLNDFFNLNYLDVFRYYYNDQNQINQISFCGQIITLSEKTKSKTFYELLIKNKKIKKELINAVENVYFKGKIPNCPIIDENKIESN
jgi:hypothetical protein